MAKRLKTISLLLASLGSLTLGAAEIGRLQPRGQDFVNATGTPVRFWGTNLVAVYPTHEAADRLAAHLAERQINLVRPHHMLRPSGDWVHKAAPIVALQSYADDTTRKADPEAWDRFDYLNAALRKQGIYLMLSVWWTRHYRPGDVDVLQTDDADRKAWMEAIAELNGWDWRRGFDVRKALCVIDERVAALEEEFARQLLTHENPYTKLRYADDPQVLTIELVNEASTEYAIICGNRFPEYFQKKLIAKWEAFARAAGIEPGDLYKPADARAAAVRGQFLRNLDEDFFLRMKEAIRSTGSKAALAYSNLWRGDSALQMHTQHADYIEDHMYGDPLVAGKVDDFILALSKTPLTDKPFIVGELNQAEGDKNILAQSPHRSMLPLAAAAYGSLQNWSGVTFFAGLHGDKFLGDDGRAIEESRAAVPPADNLRRYFGNLLADGVHQDHLRTCGIIFRRGLLQRSAQPINIHLEEPLVARDYNALMRSKVMPKAGWQSIHAIRRIFGKAPTTQGSAPWLAASPESPLVSDTKQIIKNVERKQLTVAAPQVEAFSGYLDGKPPAALQHLKLTGSGFATVVMVAEDGAELRESKRLVLSLTHVADASAPAQEQIRVIGLRKAAAGEMWRLRMSRLAKDDTEVAWNMDRDSGEVILPLARSRECELELK